LDLISIRIRELTVNRPEDYETLLPLVLGTSTGETGHKIRDEGREDIDIESSDDDAGEVEKIVYRGAQSRITRNAGKTAKFLSQPTTNPIFAPLQHSYCARNLNESLALNGNTLEPAVAQAYKNIFDRAFGVVNTFLSKLIKAYQDHKKRLIQRTLANVGEATRAPVIVQEQRTQVLPAGASRLERSLYEIYFYPGSLGQSVKLADLLLTMDRYAHVLAVDALVKKDSAKNLRQLAKRLRVASKRGIVSQIQEAINSQRDPEGADTTAIKIGGATGASPRSFLRYVTRNLSFSSASKKNKSASATATAVETALLFHLDPKAVLSHMLNKQKISIPNSNPPAFVKFSKTKKMKLWFKKLHVQ
jgi:hypothetical protein